MSGSPTPPQAHRAPVGDCEAYIANGWVVIDAPICGEIALMVPPKIQALELGVSRVSRERRP